MTKAELDQVNHQVVSLKEHFASQLDASNRANELRNEALCERLSSYNLIFTELRGAISELKTSKDKLDGKASQGAVVTANLLSIASVLIALASLVMAMIMK